ncbi:hypothetical protein [Streptomyces bacillaris]|uniref:hypothetical protein n=1 Tax=Streptomyces bacillaris TaxID=68179 RepID=UPI003631F823
MNLRPRSLMKRLKETGAVPAADCEETEEEKPTVPAPALAKPVPPAQPTTLRIGERPRSWWEPKPIISADEPPVGPAITWRDGKPYYVPAPEPKVCTHPEPHAVRSRPDNKLVAYWCANCSTQLPVPDDFDELEEVADGDGEQSEEGDEVPATVRRRWGLRGSGIKQYERPTFVKKVERQSLVDWWNGRTRQSRWLLYNGLALAGGFALGVPQFFTDEVAYLAATYDSWTDFYVVVWYGVALGIWMWDYRSRTWFPLFALAARIPLISMVVGSLLYGTTDLNV